MGKIKVKSNQGKVKVKSYVFRVVLEPDEDRWFVYCPILEEKGAASWGYTEEEALRNIREVIEMTIESMIKYGEPIPEEPEKDVKVFPEPLVVVNIRRLITQNSTL